MLWIFILIIGSVVLFHLLWWWFADARLRPLRRSALWRGLLAAFMAAPLLYIGWMMLFPTEARQAHAYLPAPLLAVLYNWLLIILPILAILLAVGGLIRLGVFAAQRIAQHWSRADEPPMLVEAQPPQGLTRRQMLGAAAAAAPVLLLGATVAVGLRQIRDFRIRRIELTLADLPPALDGMTIAHVSDVHVGRFTRGPFLGEIAEAVNQLRADLVLLTGDLIDLSLADLPAALDMVRRLDPRHGLVMCEGNHDLIENPIEFERRVSNSSIPLLLNQSKMLSLRGEPVQVLGVRWGRGEAARAEQMKRLVTRYNPDAFGILLGHHPHVFDDAAVAGIPLTLAGHTHGGQIMLNERVGAGRVLFRYVTGHYRRGRSSLIVNNGVGNWLPLRTNAPAEIIHLTLRSPQP